MKIISPVSLYFFRSFFAGAAYYFFYLHNIYLYMCLCRVDTLVCNLHNTANKFLYSIFPPRLPFCGFVFPFFRSAEWVFGIWGVWVFRVGAWFMCALSYLSCGRFLCALGGGRGVRWGRCGGLIGLVVVSAGVGWCDGHKISCQLSGKRAKFSGLRLEMCLLIA